MKKISITLPTYNEKENIEKFIQEVIKQEKNIPGYSIEIVVSDSKSPDGTAEIVKKIASKNKKVHLLEVERGLGVGLIKGHQFALANLKPDILIQMDADGQVDAEILPRLVKEIENGFNFVIGSRFVKGGKNQLSLSRKLFTLGSSVFCRLTMGPLDINEFTNSTRAFTPELFKKINLNRLPWKEKTFINQPAFLHEAILAGAKYKEIPLVFRNRAEGYSKNKTVNYTYDVITYALDAMLHNLGLNIPLFKVSRRVKTIIKFGLVGATGTAVDFLFYNFFINYFQFRPATSKGISTEIAIINNFLLNNIWTFRHRKTNHNIWQRLGIFNLVSLGGLFIGVLMIKGLHLVFGDGLANILGLQIPYYNLYFFATIPPVMIWNFTLNHLVTWRHQEE